MQVKQKKEVQKKTVSVLKSTSTVTEKELREIVAILEKRKGTVRAGSGVTWGSDKPALRDPGPTVYGRMTFHPGAPIAGRGASADIAFYRQTIWL